MNATMHPPPLRKQNGGSHMVGHLCKAKHVYFHTSIFWKCHSLFEICMYPMLFIKQNGDSI